jgi:hypothetical protein
MSVLDDLLHDIFDGKQPAFYPEFEAWVRGSRRFRTFATSYRGKIRAKLKNARDEDRMKDLRAELLTAALLLRDERFTLEYEKYAASRQRGPDFTVTFKTHTLFNVEVRRIRRIELDDEDAEARIGKLIAVLCDKLGQMPLGIHNLLWLVAENEISEEELTHAVTALRKLAERKDEAFFTRRGFDSAAGFLKQYHRLSGIVLHKSGEHLLWLNPLARHKVPPEIVTAVQRLSSR